MSRGDSSASTRGLTLSAFLLEGIAALGFIVMLVFSDRRVTPIDGFVLWTLVLGFFSALGSTLIVSPEPHPITVRTEERPERRRDDRRVVDFGSPTGIERRSGRDRRSTVIAFSDYAARLR